MCVDFVLCVFLVNDACMLVFVIFDIVLFCGVIVVSLPVVGASIII